MRHLDGRLTLLMYTSPTRLVAACGPDQGWIAFPANRVDALRADLGAEVIAEDVAIDPSWRVAAGGRA